MPLENDILKELEIIKESNQQYYIHEYSFSFIPREPKTVLNDKLTRFSTIVFHEITQLYSTTHKNAEGKSYWKEVAGTMLGLALTIVAKGNGAKVMGAAALTVSMGSIAKKTEEEANDQRSADAFLTIIKSPTEMNRLAIKLVASLLYRFENLILRLKNNETGTEKLAKTFSAQIILTVIENINQFANFDQLLDFLILNSIPSTNSPLYDYHFLNSIRIRLFSSSLTTEDNQEWPIKACLLESSVTTEVGSIYYRDTGSPEPFKFPLHKLNSETHAKISGFTEYLNVVSLWNDVLEDYGEKKQKIHPGLDGLYKFQINFLTVLFKFWHHADADLKSIASEKNKDKIVNVLTFFNSYMDYMAELIKDPILRERKEKNNLHKDFDNFGVSRMFEAIQSGETDTIQLLLLIRLACDKTHQLQALQRNHPALNVQDKKTSALLDNQLLYLQELLRTLTNFKKAYEEEKIRHNNEEKLRRNIPQTNDQKQNKLNPNIHREPIGAIEITGIAPSVFHKLIQGINPMNLNRNADFILKEFGYSDLSINKMIKGGVFILVCGVSAVVAAIVSISYGGIVVFAAALTENFYGEYLSYQNDYKKYQESKKDRESEQIQIITQTNNAIHDLPGNKPSETMTTCIIQLDKLKKLFQDATFTDLEKKSEWRMLIKYAARAVEGNDEKSIRDNFLPRNTCGYNRNFTAT